MEATRQDTALDGPDPSMGEEVKDVLTDLAATAKNEGRKAAAQAKQQGIDQISQVSRAVHGAADELGRELPQAASFIHSAAERLDTASSALRERSIEDLVATFSNFARRQPAAAFAGSVLAGFAVSRFLKSSAPVPQNRQ